MHRRFYRSCAAAAAAVALSALPAAADIVTQTHWLDINSTANVQFGPTDTIVGAYPTVEVFGQTKTIYQLYNLVSINNRAAADDAYLSTSPVPSLLDINAIKDVPLDQLYYYDQTGVTLLEGAAGYTVSFDISPAEIPPDVLTALTVHFDLTGIDDDLFTSYAEKVSVTISGATLGSILSSTETWVLVDGGGVEVDNGLFGGAIMLDVIESINNAEESTSTLAFTLAVSDFGHRNGKKLAKARLEASTLMITYNRTEEANVPVPEPTTLALAALGASTLWVRRRRR